MSEPVPPKRLRAGDVIDNQHELLLAALSRRAAGGTVKFTPSLNAKGDVQGGLEISAEIGTDMDALRELAAQVVDIGAAEFKRGIAAAHTSAVPQPEAS